MTGRTKSDRAALERLAEHIVEDILQTSDADLLAEAEADNDSEAVARMAFRRAVAASGKRWQGQRKAAPGPRQGRTYVRGLDPKTARRRLQEFIASNPDTLAKLSAVGRKDGSLSDDEVYAVLEKLQERQAFALRPRGHEGR